MRSPADKVLKAHARRVPGRASLHVAACLAAVAGFGALEPRALNVDPPRLVRFVGDSVRVTVRDDAGADVTGRVRWSAGDERVAVALPGGWVRTTGVGETSVVATLGGSSVSLPVRVTPEPARREDLDAHFPFVARRGALAVASDIGPAFSDGHAEHLRATWAYFSRLFSRTPGPYTRMYYTEDRGLYARSFAFCPSVVIEGARSVTTCWDATDRVYLWYVVPFVTPDFGTQLHEISHTFLFANYPGAEAHPWLKEGTGMYWESGALDASGRLVVTRPLPYLRDGFARWSAADALLPLDSLVTMDRDTFYGHDEPTRTYAQAGMFVFYLADRQAATWRELLRRIDEGAMPDNSALRTFVTESTGLSWPGLDRAYRAYARTLR